MRRPLIILFLLLVAGVATGVLLLTRPSSQKVSGVGPNSAPSSDSAAPDAPDAKASAFAKRTADHRGSAPRRVDELGRPLPFRESAFDGSLAEFLRRAQQGQVFSLQPFAGTRLLARVNGCEAKDGIETVSAAFEGRSERDRMFLSWQKDKARGLVMLPSENLAYEILGDSGRYTIREWLYSDVLCATPLPGGDSADTGIPRPEKRAARLTAARITAAEVPRLQSRPDAPHVIYLDFDGETVTGSNWAPAGQSIVAPAARMTASQVLETWERVCRDFEPFAVNITTVRADYDKAAIDRKIHCIITSNDQAARGAGGVAYLNSFSSTWPGDKVCWSFQDYDAKDCAEVISHELGHAFGLSHDGRLSPLEEYYAGHGSGETGWAPIMGVGYYRQLTQWSRGEYASANNPQDDIAIIASERNLPRASDDHGNSSIAATAISGDRGDGILTTPDDNDFFSITLDAGIHTIFATPSAHGNTDLELRVETPGGTVLATDNPTDRLSASATFNLASRQPVVLRVAARGKPEILGTGYSSYGSLGSYSLSGFGNQEQPPSAPIGVTTTRISGTQIRISWSPNPSALSYAVYRDGTFLSFVEGTSYLDTAAQPSMTYNYTVTASNPFGASPVSLPATVRTPAFDEFIMDGEPDFAGYLVSDTGMTIYAAVRGTKLYVATWSPGDNGSGFGSDHFVFVSDALLSSATAAAPWSKAGNIAIGSTKPYMAGESISTFAAWNNVKGATSLAKGRLNSRVMEGVIDLAAEFGPLPSNLYVAAVAYGTADGGGIASQSPSGNGNNNLEPNEFLRIPVAGVADRRLNGIYDVLDPDRAFAVTETRMDTMDRPVLRWSVIPGQTYQVQGRGALEAGAWTNLRTTTAAAAQWEMEFTDTGNPGASRFYRVIRP